MLLLFDIKDMGFSLDVFLSNWNMIHNSDIPSPASHDVNLFKLLWQDLLGFYLSNNYGGALGANALAKGLEGNKSLRVST